MGEHAKLARGFWAASRRVGGTTGPPTGRVRILYTAADFGASGLEAERLAKLAIYHRERSLGVDHEEAR